MSRTVHKFPIVPVGEHGWFNLEIPAEAKPVLVAGQMGKFQMWVELETDAPKVRRIFQLRGTGHPIAAGAKHVGSFLTNNGLYVYHVYEARS